jgi:hypothetical protein
MVLSIKKNKLDYKENNSFEFSLNNETNKFNFNILNNLNITIKKLVEKKY